MWKLLSLTFLNVSTAMACFAPPESAKIPLEEMVKMNDNIYLAEAVSMSKPGIALRSPSNIFKFNVVETLKGKSVKTLKIEGYRAHEGQALSDFNGHQDQNFWSTTSGRLINDPSCEVLPTFATGTRYLIFPLQPYTYKSLEIVKSNDDKFLRKVRELVAAQKK